MLCHLRKIVIEEGSFENEALENEDRSTKHPNLENEAPKTRKRRPLDRKRGTQNLENEAPKTRKRRPLNLENEAPTKLETSVGLISATLRLI